jgi:hydrogenase-4 component B
MIVTAFWLGLLFYLIGVLIGVAAGIAFPRSHVGSSISAGIASVLVTISGLGVLFGAPTSIGRLETGLPFGPLTFGLDPFAAFFLVVIGVVSLAAAIYTVGYLQSLDKGLRSGLPLALFNLLLLSLVLIVAATDAITLLLAWEAMAFLSYLAVNFEYENPDVIQAGYRMLAVSELGTIGIVAALLFLGQAGGGFSFAALREGGSQLTPYLRDLVFLLALFGFGAKAGLLPLQLWLPGANAAAPGHIATVLSAAVEGLGLYGIMRVLVDFLGGGPAWWGLSVLCLGAVTAFVGILHALTERDLKRLLAYSTIENDGIIVAAIGLSLTYRSFSLGLLAGIAGLFALYHLLNHALYKGLLFLGAGAVDRATGTRDLERLGGLIHRMPSTALAFLVGCLAIAAVAPFAGYISEWGILESMLQSFAVPDTLARLAIAGSGALLALTAALAVTTFVRTYAVGFLAQPRSDEAAAAHDVPRTMRVAMWLLAVVSILLGALPSFVITTLDRVSTPLWGTSVLDRVVPPLFTDHPGAYAPLVGLGGGLFRGLPVNGLVIIPSPTLSTINSPTYLILAEVVLIGVVVLGVRLIRSLGSVRIGPVWAGGIPRFAPRMQYGAVAYSNPARLIFNGIYRSRAELVAVAAAARHGQGEISYRQNVPPPLEDVLYRPVRDGVEAIAERVKVIQSGSVNQYVLYIFAMVLIILVLRAV